MPDLSRKEDIAHLIVHGGDRITSWERGFLASVSRFDALSPKQNAVVDKLLRKVRTVEA